MNSRPQSIPWTKMKWLVAIWTQPLNLLTLSSVFICGAFAQSDYLHIPAEVVQAHRELSTNLTQEKIQSLPDNSPVLAEFYRSRIALEMVRQRAGEPKQDIVELDMWMRGDTAIDIVKGLFANPPSDDTQMEICHWLRYRPWMKPDHFLSISRMAYKIHSSEEPKGIKSRFTAINIAEFLAHWGEPQDEALLRNHFAQYKTDQWSQDQLMMRFKERQALRAEGNPRGLPSWFFKEKQPFITAVPDRMKTYKETKTGMNNLERPSTAIAKAPDFTQLSEGRTKPVGTWSDSEKITDVGPPWTIISGAVVTLIALLFLQGRLRRKI